jgi:type I restriction enzyme, S subunit
MKLPKDWNIKTLEEISHKVMVGIASAATHAYRDSGVIMLRNLNIKENRIDESDLLFIDPEYELQHKNKRIKTGDVITVRTGYPGVSAVVTDKFQSAQCFTSLITRPKSELVNSHFLSAYINSEYGKKFIVEAEAGGAQKNVNAGSLSKMPIPLPSMKEQCKIIKVLGVWDESIDLLEKLISAKHKLKQVLMRQLLTGKHRFREFKDSKWENTSIIEIAKLTAGGTPDTNIVKYWNGDIPWMKSGDINLKRVHNVEGRITQSGFDNSSTKKIPPYSVLIALAGQGKTRGLVAVNEVEICTNQSIAAIMPNSNKRVRVTF